MKTFIIEREVPGASLLSHAELKEISTVSNAAVASLGVEYEWVTTYVAGDKLYCIHRTDDAETVREHARRGGFPANLVAEVVAEFGPHTAAEMVG
ncbi:DUF4242 domain-containing protein [Agromyces endophyticus]|uniref:DUF4242 domain-containing protein n=1 Tax=Agromyces sp. H17E-10 TaxID=2932244 RepID=UPI001FD49BB7|nr:DUF4242 domain-containing protein [Agromyces sp. H17E-10]UOQ91024.1 DUF4242 domain-containing protein [Agromyces sp. H17E-10]